MKVTKNPQQNRRAYAMNIVPHHHHSCEAASSKIQQFFTEFHVSQILRSCNAYKLRGFAVMAIFLVAFEAAFQRRSFYQRKKDAPESIPFERDTFYRFLNSCAIHWRKFTLLLGTAIIQKAIAPLTSGARRNVLIIDDSLFSRNRSKKVELLARVYDHVSGTYMKGFRMLTLGWSDGNTFLPLSHCLLSSSSKQQQLQGASEDVDPRSNGGKQRKLAQCKAPEVVLTLLQEAREAGAPAQHVLFDSWFCSPASLHQIHELGYDVIARVKKSEKMHFCFQGCMQDVMVIYRSQKKRRGRSAYLLSVEAEAVKDGKRLPVRLVYVRNKNKRSDYLVLVSTDLTLSEEEIIQTYGKRWNIEVFFKMCKSYLKLGKETRSISYDALTAHTAIVFARYMMLALEQRRNMDERSLGELFYLTMDELEDLHYLDALASLLSLLMDCAKEAEILDEEQVNQLLDLFMAKLPDLWGKCLKQCA